MSRGRHSLAPTTVRTRRTALLAAPLVTALVIGTGVAVHDVDAGSPAPTTLSSAGAALTPLPASGPTPTTAPEIDRARQAAVSRSVDRAPLAPPVPKATGRLWTTAALDLRLAPRAAAATAGVVKDGQHVAVTGVRRGHYAQVVLGRSARWVTASYLSQDKVQEPGSRGLVDTPCAGTSGVENGLTSGAVRVYRAVCNNFPQITTYGGYAPRGEHASGKAIDIMTSDTALGTQIAEFLKANAAALDLYDIIWQQHIWTPVRASEGWRAMSDRGSETANHFDHVHVSVN